MHRPRWGRGNCKVPSRAGRPRAGHPGLRPAFASACGGGGGCATAGAENFPRQHGEGVGRQVQLRPVERAGGEEGREPDPAKGCANEADKEA